MYEKPPYREYLKIFRNHADMFGFGAAVRSALAYWLEPSGWKDGFDAKYGTQTSTWVPAAEGGLPAEFSVDASEYGPTPEATMRHVLRSLPIRCEDFDFVDLGSGQGRAVILASDYPFAKITGVELSPRHARGAVENLEKYRRRFAGRMKCDAIELIEGNLLDYVFPDKNILVFMSHPASGQVFHNCMQRIAHAGMERPNRQLYVSYVNPRSADPWLGASGHFELVRRCQVIHAQLNWSLWKYKRMTPP